MMAGRYGAGLAVLFAGFLLGGATGGAGAVSLIGGMSAAISAGLIDLALVCGAAAPFSERA